MTCFLVSERLGCLGHGFGLPPGSQPSLQRIHPLHSVLDIRIQRICCHMHDFPNCLPFEIVIGKLRFSQFVKSESMDNPTTCGFAYKNVTYRRSGPGY